MTLWEFTACMDGLRAFHGGKTAKREADWDEDQLADLGIEGF